MTKHKGAASYADYEFLRAACVEQAELEKGYNVRVSSSITMRCRVGYLEVVLEAFDEDYSIGDAPLCRYRVEWPNANVASFPGCLYNAHVQLARLVDDRRRDMLGRLGGHGR